MKGQTDKFNFYKDASGQWRWQRIDTGNHKIVGASTEGYHNGADCVSNAERNGFDRDVHENNLDALNN